MDTYRGDVMNKAALQSHNVIFSNNFFAKHLTSKCSNIAYNISEWGNLCKVVYNIVIDNGAWITVEELQYKFVEKIIK